MPEILPSADLSRLTGKSAPSTRSSSPGPSSSSYSASPAVQPGALSPPPPTHYLRNVKQRDQETTDKSLKLLRKRSEIYDRDRSRSRRSTPPRSPPASGKNANPDGLLFQQDLFSPAHVESIVQSWATRMQDGVGSPSGSPLILSPSRQWAFLDTDPMTSKKQHRPTRDREVSQPKGLVPHSVVASDSSPSVPIRSLSSSLDSHSNNSLSRRGSLSERDLTPATAADTTLPHRLSLNRFHHGRNTGSESSISVSVSSHTSSSIFPPSLEPCSKYSPPVQSAFLPSFASSGLQVIRHTSSTDSEPFSPLAPSPQSAPALFDVQKRRRAHAFDHFTSYTETLPYHGRGSKNDGHKRQPSSARDQTSHVVESLGDASSSSLESKTLHSTRSVPDLSEHAWRKDSLGLDVEDGNEKAAIYPDSAQLNPPRRKSGCKVISGLKSMLTSKHSAPSKE